VRALIHKILLILSLLLTLHIQDKAQEKPKKELTEELKFRIGIMDSIITKKMVDWAKSNPEMNKMQGERNAYADLLKMYADTTKADTLKRK